MRVWLHHPWETYITDTTRLSRAIIFVTQLSDVLDSNLDKISDNVPCLKHPASKAHLAMLVLAPVGSTIILRTVHIQVLFHYKFSQKVVYYI